MLNTWLARSTAAVFIIGGLVGCQTTDSLSSANSVSQQSYSESTLDWRSDEFKSINVNSIEDIFTLSSEQQQDFLNYYFSLQNAHVEGHERLYNYLDNMLYGFDYRGDTHTAFVALNSLSGNCLSLAILTTAFADLVQLDIRYQRINTAPIYQRFHNVMTLSSHVRTHVFAPEEEVKENEIIVSRKKMIIDYFPEKGNVTGDFIDKSQFLSMYYQNLAGDSLVAKNYDLTYSLLSKAMDINHNDPETLNTLAVFYKKLGDVIAAERIYKYALENTSGSVNILSNYALLLEEQKRIEELTNLNETLSLIEDDNPYRWYDLANRHFAKHELFYALRYFKRAVKAAPYLHEGYFGLAKTYYQMDRKIMAKLYMDKAIELAFTPQDKVLYQAKLKVINTAAH